MLLGQRKELLNGMVRLTTNIGLVLVPASLGPITHDSSVVVGAPSANVSYTFLPTEI